MYVHTCIGSGARSSLRISSRKKKRHANGTYGGAMQAQVLLGIHFDGVPTVGSTGASHE